MLNDNIMLLTDSYKASHAVQYPSGTQHIFSYFESRGGEFAETVFVGLQYLIKRYLEGEVVTQAKLDEAKAYWDAHLGPNVFDASRWQYIIDKHQGRLPIIIHAVPEGTVVPVSNVLMTVENTDVNCYWLTNFLETLLVQVWYPCTTATISREMKKDIKNALEISGDPAGLPFKLHDFGCRGVSSMETAAIGGFAHLVNFMGTDTVPALQLAKDYYGAEMAGFSIPAAEHSTITSWGREHEIDAFRNMLKQFPTGLVAVVSDSYDIFEACKIWGTELYDEVMGRDGTLVVRPDSGDPEVVVPEVLATLAEYFPCTVNDAGLKVLDSHVRVIQGDGIGRDSINGIMGAVISAGFSMDNVAFGSGGGLLQSCNRDTQRFAFKCSAAIINDETVLVSKSPVGAPWKASKAGRLMLVKFHGSYHTVTTDNTTQRVDEIVTRCVFMNGELIEETTLEDIRELAEI